MKGSILKKGAVVLSIVAMGFGFQNCSGGGGGTGGGSGSIDDGGGTGGGFADGGVPQGGHSDNDSGPALPTGPVNCRGGFVGVPGNRDYNTQDFCVMKYEAKAVDDNGDHATSGCRNDSCRNAAHALDVDDYKPSVIAAHRPWVFINRNQAIAECQSMGAGYALLTNAHWQTIARNIELVAKNWATGVIGNVGGLNRGHSVAPPSHPLPASTEEDEDCFGIEDINGECDSETWNSQKRTHFLSNRGEEEVIWDIAGNVNEWVSDNNTAGDYGLGVLYISTLAEPHPAKARFGPSGNYSNISLENSSYRNLGEFSGAGGGVIRGGSYNNWLPQSAGVFATSLSEPLEEFASTGFRCFYSP